MTSKKLMGVLAGLFFAVACLWVPVNRAEDFSDVTGPVKWKVYEYHRGRLRATRLPYRVTEGIAFDFLETPVTASLVTPHHSYEGDLLGDLSGKILQAVVEIEVTPGTEFTYSGDPDACGDPANVRFYFETDTSGRFEETDYWWSNLHPRLDTLTDQLIMIFPMSFPSLWSDDKGHLGSTDPAHEAAFADAVRNVRRIGLSFGGGCSHGNGVGIRPGTGSGYFNLKGFYVY